MSNHAAKRRKVAGVPLYSNGQLTRINLFGKWLKLPNVPPNHWMGVWGGPGDQHFPRIEVICQAEDDDTGGRWWEKAIYRGDSWELGIPVVLEPSILFPALNSKGGDA